MGDVTGSAIQLNNTLSQKSENSQNDDSPRHQDSQTASEYARDFITPRSSHGCHARSFTDLTVLGSLIASYSLKRMRAKLFPM